MRIAFAGTPPFAAAALQALLDAGHAVALVLTQPDRPAGRGMKLQPSAVKRLAQSHALPLAQPRGLKLDGRFADDAQAARRALADAAPQLLVVAAYGLILPAWTLALPPRGALNIHASLLPRWRGAAPVQRAIEAGDRETGITLMAMDEGLDTGAMLARRAEPIRADDSAETLLQRLAALGGAMAADAVTRLDRGEVLPAEPQPADGATYAAKIAKAEAPIDWSQPAAAIERRVRAFDPFPGATFEAAGQTLKLWRAVPADGAALAGHAPGTLVEAGEGGGLAVVCGDGRALVPRVAQRAGAARADAAAVLRGLGLRAGQRLGTPPLSDG